MKRVERKDDKDEKRTGLLFKKLGVSWRANNNYAELFLGVG